MADSKAMGTGASDARWSRRTGPGVPVWQCDGGREPVGTEIRLMIVSIRPRPAPQPRTRIHIDTPPPPIQQAAAAPPAAASFEQSAVAGLTDTQHLRSSGDVHVQPSD